jgi:hypothetical protein
VAMERRRSTSRGNVRGPHRQRRAGLRSRRRPAAREMGACPIASLRILSRSPGGEP